MGDPRVLAGWMVTRVVTRCGSPASTQGASVSLTGENWLDWPMRETTSTRS